MDIVLYYENMHTYIHTLNTCIYIFIYIHIFIHIFLYIHEFIHCVATYIQSYILTYIHICNHYLTKLTLVISQTGNLEALREIYQQYAFEVCAPFNCESDSRKLLYVKNDSVNNHLRTATTIYTIIGRGDGVG